MNQTLIQEENRLIEIFMAIELEHPTWMYTDVVKEAIHRLNAEVS